MIEEVWRCTICNELNVIWCMGDKPSTKTELHFYCKNGCVNKADAQDLIKGKSLLKRVFLEGEREAKA